MRLGTFCEAASASIVANYGEFAMISLLRHIVHPKMDLDGQPLCDVDSLSFCGTEASSS